MKRVPILLTLLSLPLFGEANYRTYLPSESCPIPLTLALPEDYIVAPTNPNHTPILPVDIAEGVLWGSKQEIERAYHNWFGTIRNLETGLFRVKISSDFTFEQFSEMMRDDQILRNHLSAGMQVTGYNTFYWADFPVVAMESNISDIQMKSLWVGLPYSQAVLHITYFPAKNDTGGVWKRFLAETGPLDQQSYLQALGIEIKEGWSRYSQSTCTIEGYAEQERESGKIKVQLKPISERTTFEVKKIQTAKIDDSPAIKLSIQAVRNDPAKGWVHADYVFTIIPKEVEAFTLSGDPLSEIDQIIVLK